MLLKRENKENRRVVLTIQVEQEAWEKALEESLHILMRWNMRI